MAIWGSQQGTGGGGAGTPGTNGWSPLVAIEADGARRVLRVVNWAGGSGIKPATGSYIGATGLVAAVADAVDIRGADGPPGQDGLGAAWGAIAGTLASQVDLQAALDAKETANANIQPHIASTANPHNVTKAQVGLGIAENKSSADIRAELTSGNVAAALGYTPESAANKGAANGYTPLGADSKVPAAHLPSYVDDVIEAATIAALPATGETGKIYITLDNPAVPKQWRWSGTAYAEITASPGSTDAVTEGATNLYFTAGRVLDVVLAGLSTATNAAISAADTVLSALGKLQAQFTAHFASTANPHGVTKAQVGLGNADNTADADKPVSTAAQAALDGKQAADANTAKTNVGQTFTKPQKAGTLALTHNTAWNGALASGSQHLTVNVNGSSFTIANPSAQEDGLLYMVYVAYTTTHSIAWGTNFKGLSGVTATATAGAIDTFFFRSNGTNLILTGYSLDGGA